MKKERFKYEIPSVMMGIDYRKLCWAASDSEAAKKLEVSLYNIRNYALKYKSGAEFENVMGYMDSGRIIFEEGRKDLNRKEMPLEELAAIIDKYQQAFYAGF